ncbi:MAG: hypothetical protein ACLGH0_14520, partial [Thermoanaerobaculia bacterium]
FDLHADVLGNSIIVAWRNAGEIRSARIVDGAATPVDAFAAPDLQLHDIAGDTFVFGDDRTRFFRRGGVTQPLPVPAELSTVSDAATNGAQTVLIARGLPRLGFPYGPAGSDLYVQQLDDPAPRPLVTAPRHQQSVDVANGLAVWSEYIGSERRLSVVAGFLGSSGSSEGLDLRANTYHPVVPHVASSGDGWLVAWCDATTVYGSRIAADGTLLDAQPFVIASGVYEGTDVAVSWDGTSYVVVFLRGIFLRGLQTTITAARVTSSGSVQEIALSSVGANEFPAIARGLVVWINGTQLRGAFAATGAPVSFPNLHAIRPRPAVAAHDDGYIVASPVSGPFGAQLRWFAVNANGVVSAPEEEFPMLGFPAATDATAFDSGVLLSYRRDGAVYALLVDRNGAILEAPTYLATAASFATSGATLVYARTIGHPTRELQRAFTRTLSRIAKQPKRRGISLR